MSEDQDKRKKRSNVEIREMEIDDLPAIFHLGERLFTSKKAPTLYRTWDVYEVTGIFQEDPEFCLVAEADGKIIGFAMGTTITKARSAWKYGHLIWLGVDPDYQRSRIATRLFNRFRDKTERTGVRILLVDTEGHNESAISFFRAMGFGNPEEHVYLTLNLDQRQALQRILRRRSHGGRAHER